MGSCTILEKEDSGPKRRDQRMEYCQSDTSEVNSTHYEWIMSVDTDVEYRADTLGSPSSKPARGIEVFPPVSLLSCGDSSLYRMTSLPSTELLHE
jgi:hypothetical protein